jgi:hypothetical protein
MTERLFGWCDAGGGVKIIDTIFDGRRRTDGSFSE